LSPVRLAPFNLEVTVVLSILVLVYPGYGICLDDTEEPLLEDFVFSSSLVIHSFMHSFMHLLGCLMTGP